MSRDVIKNSIESCITDLEPSTEQEAIQALASCVMSLYSFNINQSPYCVHPERIHSEECENMGCLLCKNKFVAELQNKLENKLKQIKGGPDAGSFKSIYRNFNR